LVDHEGYYLAHPEADKLWGSPHDLNTGANLRRDAPEVADRVLSGQAGVVYVGDEVWVYVPIFPAPGRDPAYFWVLIRRDGCSTRPGWRSIGWMPRAAGTM